MDERTEKERLTDEVEALGGTVGDDDTIASLKEKKANLTPDEPDEDLGPVIESGGDEPEFEQHGSIEGVQPDTLDDVPESGL
jgi:hypothetical protein